MSYDAADLWDCQAVLTHTRGYPHWVWYETPEKARAAYAAACAEGLTAELHIRGPHRSGIDLHEKNSGTMLRAGTRVLTSQEMSKGYYHVDCVRARQVEGRFW